MNYNKFAYVYDRLMKGTPYHKWVKLTEEIIEKYKIAPNQIIDLGCGTGNIAIPLSLRGYNMIGIDLSADMLSIAYDKMISHHVSFPLIQQDMKELQIPDQTEMIISFCDSLNYLAGAEELKQTFIQVNKQLISGGYFIFDMHSPYKITKIFNQQSFAWNDEEISVIWLTDIDKEQLIVEHDLTFFVETTEDCFEKFQEIHKQQTYTIETVEKVLNETGFELIATYGDYQLQPVQETSERIFYIVKKCDLEKQGQ